MSSRIMMASFECLSSGYLVKFAANSAILDDGKSTMTTTMINIMDAMGRIMTADYNRSVRLLLGMPSLTIGTGTDLASMLTSEELAFYIVLMCLYSLTRNEIKNKVLKSSSVLSLLDMQPETSDIFENYLNGRFEKFQSQLNLIERKLKYDQFFGEHEQTEIFKKIRVKALQQYVAPYKRIDMREISSAFGVPLDQIEVELAELITSGEIKAKIDSHNKLLISRKENV
jgi:COP9 signalosome complex subunit 1